MKGLAGFLMLIFGLLGFGGFLMIVLNTNADLGTALLVVGCIGCFGIKFLKETEGGKKGGMFDSSAPFMS